MRHPTSTIVSGPARKDREPGSIARPGVSSGTGFAVGKRCKPLYPRFYLAWNNFASYLFRVRLNGGEDDMMKVISTDEAEQEEVTDLEAEDGNELWD